MLNRRWAERRRRSRPGRPERHPDEYTAKSDEPPRPKGRRPPQAASRPERSGGDRPPKHRPRQGAPQSERSGGGRFGCGVFIAIGLALLLAGAFIVYSNDDMRSRLSELVGWPAATPSPVPTTTPTPVPTSALMSMPLPTSTPTPLSTSTPTPMPTSAPTLMPTSTSTPLPADTPTPTPTAMPTPELTPTHTPTPELTPTHTPTPELTPTYTPTPEPTTRLVLSAQPKVMGYWSDGTVNVEITATLENKGTLRVDGGQEITVICKAPLDCREELSLRLTDGFGPSSSSFKLRLPMGSATVDFDYGEDGPLVLQVDVPERILRVDRDLWECYGRQAT